MGFQVDTSGTLEDSLESFWRLEEASGTRSDAVGPNNLSDNNTVTQNTGIVNQAAQFTSANSEYLSASSDPTLNFGPDDSLSISIWVYLDSKNNVAYLQKWTGAGSQRSYRVGFSSGDDRFIFRVSGDGSASTFVLADNFGSPSTGTWYNIVCTHDPVSNQISIRVNDGSVDTASHSGGIFSSSADFRLGTDEVITFHNGRIDEVGIWRKVLSSQEISDLYNGGSGNEFTSSPEQTITSDTSIEGTTEQTIQSDSEIVEETTQTIPSDTLIAGTTSQIIQSDTSVEGTTEQTIESNSAISGTTSQTITSSSEVVIETAQTIQSVTEIVVNPVVLKLFKESDLSTDVGTIANPLDFSNVAAGTTVEHPDNPFVLFNDKGGTFDSVDARDVTIRVLELNLVDELAGTSNGAASQTFTAAFPPMDSADAVVVKVNDVAWTEVSSFTGTSPTDEVYTVNRTTGVVTFGDGTQGKIPTSGHTIKLSYTPDTILYGKQAAEQLWVGVQSNDVISNTVNIELERVSPLDVNTVQTLRSPIAGVTGVFLNTDPNRLGTNYFSGGSFNSTNGIITLGTSLPNTNDVFIDYTYTIVDDLEAGFTQVGRTVPHLFANRIPSNNAKKLNFRVVVPGAASPSNPQAIRFKIRIEYKQ